jgi:hypothetical protein
MRALLGPAERSRGERMLREMLRTAALLGAVAFTGCGSDVGNDGATVGGSCVVSSECADISICRTGDQFPGGYCANACNTSEDCKDGSVCADVLGGICVVSCAGASDCRSDEDYACEALPALGAVGEVNGCVAP